MLRQCTFVLFVALGLTASAVQAGVNSGAAHGVTSGARVKMPEKNPPAEEKDSKNTQDSSQQQPKQQ